MRMSGRSTQDPTTRKDVLLQLAVSQGELAAYQYVNDAARRLVRVGIRCVVDYRCGIEHRNIRIGTNFETPFHGHTRTVVLQHLCGQVRHFRNRFLQSQCAFSPDVAPENA